MSNKTPYVLSWILTTWTFFTLWWLFALPITLTVWLSSWILVWSYLLFKWINDKDFENKMLFLKNEVINLNKEINLNKKYLEEYKEYFYSDSKIIKNIEKYMDILIFKNIFFSTDIEKKLYVIKDEISSIFLTIDNIYQESKIDKKEKVLKTLTEINDLKNELNALLMDTKNDIIIFMNETLESINQAKIELEKIENKDTVIKNNITILETHYNLLKNKINEFSK